MKRIDYDDFDGCLSGPEGGLPQPECNCFDLDSDHDVDLSDIRQFQHAFTGDETVRHVACSLYK